MIIRPEAALHIRYYVGHTYNYWWCQKTLSFFIHVRGVETMEYDSTAAKHSKYLHALYDLVLKSCDLISQNQTLRFDHHHHLNFPILIRLNMIGIFIDKEYLTIFKFIKLAFFSFKLYSHACAHTPTRPHINQQTQLDDDGVMCFHSSVAPCSVFRPF